MPNNFCIVIPHFNHDEQLQNVLSEIKKIELPVIIVDDGSEERSYAAVRSMTARCSEIMLSRIPSNTGKGAAVLHGIRIARDRGFTHAIQIDADGQHCVADTRRLMAESERYPDLLISGLAVFGEDVPKSRLYGRKFTLWWTKLETLSGAIKDAMCGFRVYPIAPFLDICEGQRIGRRMEFDIEILVRSIWNGQQIRYIPTRVEYPARGLSHFKLIRDNLLISLTHTKLVFGMLVRLPRLMSAMYRSKKI
jgi:glycosyltransferase involved in cell wall biosynthesis